MFDRVNYPTELLLVRLGIDCVFIFFQLFPAIVLAFEAKLVNLYLL